jgi:hypothetical protein
MNTRILNLTQHDPTPEQLEAGVTCGDIANDAELLEFRKLLTFDTLPTPTEVRQRAQQIAAYAAKTSTLVDYGGDSGLCVNEPLQRAMIGGAPFLMAPLEDALRRVGIVPLYAFSIRESAEQVQPDGSVRKTAVFRHVGFVGCEADEEEEVELLSQQAAAEAYEFVSLAGDEWRASHAKSAESVTALFEQMRETDDACNLKLAADGGVGIWSAEGYLSFGKTATIVAVCYDGVVYRF